MKPQPSLDGITLDITGQKLAEEAARHSAQLYSRLVNSLDCIVWEADAQTFQFSFVSPQAERMLGYPTEQWLSPGFWTQHVHREDVEWCTKFCIEATKQGRDHEFEYRMIAADGRTVWLHDVVSVQMAPEGPRQLTGVMIDVTSRKVAETARKESEERFRLVFEKSAAGMVIGDTSGRIIRANKTFCDFVGFTEDELRGRLALEITHPEDRAATQTYLDQAKSGQDTVYELEKRYIRRDGQVVWGRISAVFICSNAFTPYSICVVQDISGRKRAEEALRKSEEHFRILVEQASDGIGISDRYGNWIEVNSAWATMLGRTREESSQQEIGDNMAVEDKARLAEELANLQGGRTLRSEWKIRRKDGSFFPCEVSAKRLPDGRLQVIARDVTERRRTEDMLREREERLRSLFNHQIVGMAVTSPEKRWLEVNDTWCQMMGYSREELAGLDWATLTHPEDLPADLEQFGRILSGKSDRYQLEKRFIRKDGTVLYAEVSVGCVRRPDGSPEYIVGLAANISERKRAEELLRESEERFRTIFENAGLGMALVDWQGYPVKCNPALQKMLGFTENELSNMVFTEFTHPDDVDLDWRLYSELVTGKRDKYEIEKRYIKKDGQVMWGQLTVSQVKNKDGTPAKYMVGMVEDITERKRAEEQLRRSEERYRSLIEATSEKVWTAQAGPGAVEVASWREFTGQTAEEARDNWLAAVHPDDREQTKTAWLNFLKKGGVYDEQYRLRRRDGEYRWLSVRGVPVRERDGRIREWIGTFKDITERKRTERELRAAHDRLTKELAERTRAEAEIVRLSERLIKAQEEERTRIAGELHDHLSQQIAGLGIALSNIKRQIPEHRREGRNQAERAYDRLLALGEGIRQLSHELHPAIIEHSGLVPALESYCTEFESRTNVSVTVQAEGQFDDLSANARLGIYRIAQEALHNIWKHSGVKEAGIYLAHAGERVQMRVSDRGAGFDPAQPSKEVGLGLISMRERARLLGGTFTVESSAGRGTTITVDIPVNHISQAKASD